MAIEQLATCDQRWNYGWWRFLKVCEVLFFCRIFKFFMDKILHQQEEFLQTLWEPLCIRFCINHFFPTRRHLPGAQNRFAVLQNPMVVFDQSPY